MVALTTPTTQTVHGSVIDQSIFQSVGQYANTPPSTYLTRILSTMMSAAHSSNTVLHGLDVISITGQNTNVLNFTLSPGAIVIDSNIIHFPNNTIVPIDPIPATAPSKLRIGIFASYSFNVATAASSINNVVFTSYIFDTNDALIAPTIWGGGEKILLASYTVDMAGPELAPTMHIPNWTKLGNAATLSGTNAQLSVTNTQSYAASAHLSTSIPSGTVCDFTADVVSGNALLRVGNTGVNSQELLNLSSNVAATMVGQFTTTSNVQYISLGNSLNTQGSTSIFDNVQITYPSATNILTGDNSTFTASIGSWIPSSNDSAYWDGIGSLAVLPNENASKDFIIGTDIQPNTIYALSSTSATNASVSVGTTGVLSADILTATAIANNTRIMFTTPATGTVTITIHGTGNVNPVLLGDITIEQSLINGDSSTFTNGIGSWVANAATVTAVAGQLNVLDTSALASTGHAGITVNVVNGKTYTLLISTAATSTSAYYYVSGTALTTPITATIGIGVSIAVSIVANATGTIDIQLGSAAASTLSIFDNITLLDNVNTAVLPGDNSSFTTSIGTWIPSVYTASTNAGILTLQNTSSMVSGSETDITQTVSLIANTNYQFELTGVTGGIFQVLDGVTVIASSSADGIIKFMTTTATTYILRFFNPTLTLGSTASISNINLFERLNAISATDSTFTSITGWGTSSFDIIEDAGNALLLRNALSHGAEVSISLTGLVIGHVYRVICQGSSLAQVLVNGTVLAIGNVNSVFTASVSTETLTLRVNSNIIGDEATFRGVRVFEDNTHVARLAVPSNAKSSGGNLKALSVGNTSKTIKTEITIVGHGTFKVKGDDPITRQAEVSILNALDASTASWVLDIPKIKPTATSLAYEITGILL